MLEEQKEKEEQKEIKKCHYFPFQQVWKVFCATLWDLCFPHHITIYIDTLLRFIFALYYLPPIALTLAITHSALERIVWVLIVPVLNDIEIYSYYDSLHMANFVFSFYNIIFRILPFTTLGIAVSTFGHKVLNCLLETMVDAYLTHQGKDYPLLAAQLRFVMEDKKRYYIFLIVLIIFLFVVIFGLHTNMFLTLPKREVLVVMSSWFIIFIQFCFVFLSAISHPLLPSQPITWKRIFGLGDGKIVTFFYGIWWDKYIYYIKYLAIEMILLIAFISFFFYGPLYVLSSCVEIILYLNIPHLVGHVVMSVSICIINIQRSLLWLKRHGDATLPVLILLFPYKLLLLQAIYFFRHHWLTVTLFLILFVLLFARVIDFVREFDVTDAGSVHWKCVNEDKLLPPHLSIILEDAYETNLSGMAVVSLDMLIDIKAMKLHCDGVEMSLERKQVFPYGNAQSFIWSGVFYAYTVPRLLSVQSQGYFSGKHFKSIRTVLRTFTVCLLLLFVILVVGFFLQAVFPQLRPWPVKVYVSENKSILTVDHILVHTHLLSKKANISTDLPDNIWHSTKSAFTAFKWNNVSNFGNNNNSGGGDLYPSLCTKSFYGISIWEISLLALTSYLFNEEEVSEMLQFMSSNMNSDWVIKERHGTDCVTLDSSTEPTGWDGYFEFYSAKNNISVISIRGTDMMSFRDYLFDVNIFFDVIIYHFLSNIVPGAAILPSELVADLLRLASIPATKRQTTDTWESLILKRNKTPYICENNNYRRDFFVDIHNHIAFLASKPNPPKHILLTGHSLGGTIASIIGSRMGIHAVSFSAPCISLLRKRFDVNLQSIYMYVTSVISSHDIFAMIGGNSGEEHHVNCLAKTRELCHAMENLIGILWHSCESIRMQFPSIESFI